MKRDWVQTASLCICCVLLVVTISQGRRLNSMQRNLMNQMDSLRADVEREMQYISNDIRRELQEADRVVADYSLEPEWIDTENRTLIASAAVTLKEWHDDTKIVLIAKVGEAEQSLPMESEGGGRYVGRLALPVEGSSEVQLEAVVSGGGLSRKEPIHAWGDISMMLPLLSGGGGWSGPNYLGGVMSSQFNITIEGQDGSAPAVNNPQFLTYINGELALTQDAVEDPHSSSSSGICYTVDAENNQWQVQCELGDVVEVRFRCEDEFGLGYDFPFQTWTAQADTDANQASAGAFSGSVSYTLYWPE